MGARSWSPWRSRWPALPFPLPKACLDPLVGKEQGQGLKPGLLPLSPMEEGEIFSGGMLVSRECTLSPMPPQSPFPLVQIGIMNPAEPPPPAPVFHLSPTDLETRVGPLPLPSITEMCPCSPGAPGKLRHFWGFRVVTPGLTHGSICWLSLPSAGVPGLCHSGHHLRAVGEGRTRP